MVADFNDIGFYHSDLKPSNTFYLADKTSIDKIKLILIDFGLVSTKKYNNNYKGTRSYMAYEISESDKTKSWYNETIDVFSASSSIIEFLTERFL